MFSNRKTLGRIFLGVAGCIILYWLLHETERVRSVWGFVKGVFSPFVVGAALAFILNVPMRSIENRLSRIKIPGLRRAIAIVLTLLAILLVLTLVFWLILPQVLQTIQTLSAKLPPFFQNLYNKAKEMLESNPELMESIKTSTSLESMNWGDLIEKAFSVVGNSVTSVLDGAVLAITSLSAGIFNGVISFVFALYSLARKEILARQARRLAYAFLPERFCDRAVRVLRLTNETFSNFISGQCLEAVILGCMFAIAMLIFRMPYIPLISVLIGVTALVPIVGAFAGCALGAFFIFVDNPVMAFWFIVMFLVIQQIEGNVIYPKVVGSSVGLPGMWVLLAVTVGGNLMGVGGMLLAVPLCSVCYTLLREQTAYRLSCRGIDGDKLRDHPMQMRKRLERRNKRKKQQGEKREENG